MVDSNVPPIHNAMTIMVSSPRRSIVQVSMIFYLSPFLVSLPLLVNAKIFAIVIGDVQLELGMHKKFVSNNVNLSCFFQHHSTAARQQSV